MTPLHRYKISPIIPDVNVTGRGGRGWGRPSSGTFRVNPEERTRGNYASLRFDFNLFCFLQAHLAYEFYQNQIQIVIYRPKLKE